MRSNEAPSFALNVVTRYGPVPSGAMFCESHVTAAAPTQPANCVLLMIGVPAPTKALYGYDVGALKVMRTVRVSAASTDVMPEKASPAVQPVASSVQ